MAVHSDVDGLALGWATESSRWPRCLTLLQIANGNLAIHHGGRCAAAVYVPWLFLAAITGALGAG